MRSLRFPSLVAFALIAACGGSTPPKPTNGGGGGGGSGGGGAAGDGSGGSSGGGSTGEAPSGSSEAPSGSSEAPAASAEKIDAALPDTREAKPFPRRWECGGKGCNLALLVPDTLKGQIEKDAPVFLYELTMPPKVMMLLPKHAGVDVYGLLIDGEISVYADDIKEKQKRAWRMNGFRIPGAGANIYSKEPTRMLFAVVVNGTSGSVESAVAQLEKKDKSIHWTKRPSPITAFELDQKPDLAWGGGAYHARLAYEQGGEGAPPASLGVLLMSKNAPVAEHTHDKEWEFLAIVEGEGELSRKTGGKTSIAGSSFVSIAPGVAHSFKPSGNKPTFALQMYWPPGPEQRFKKLAEGK